MATINTVEQRPDDIETVVKSIRDDLVPIKDAHTRNVTLREADLIAEDLGFTLADPESGGHQSPRPGPKHVGHSRKRTEKLPPGRPDYGGHGRDGRNLLSGH